MAKPTHKVSPYNAESIRSHQYSTLVAGHYRMNGNYHIKRPAGTHDWLLILTRSGKGRIRHAGGDLVLKPGQLAAFMPETPHNYMTNPDTGRWELLWVHFHPMSNWLQLLDWPVIAPGLRLLDLPGRTQERKKITELFMEMHKVSVSSIPLRNWLSTNILETILIRCHTLAGTSKSAIHPELDNIRTYIHNNLTKSLSLDQLAGESRLSISYLSTLFRQQLHTTPQQYIEHCRMDMAKRLMNFSNRSIKEIAHDVGYGDPLYFSKRFRKNTGYTPQMYRTLPLNIPHSGQKQMKTA